MQYLKELSRVYQAKKVSVKGMGVAFFARSVSKY
jgi:hypothetical protein